MKKLLIIGLIFVCVGCNQKEEPGNFEPVYDVTYVGDEGSACLTFSKNGTYSLYDCDSEPTTYFFDSEAECKYSYSGYYMKFKCKYNIYNHKGNKIKVLNWTDSEFKFEYDKEIKIFKKQ